MKYIILLLLTACSGKQSYLDSRVVGKCTSITAASTKFYKIAGLDSRGYILRELVLTDTGKQEVVEFSYFKILNEPLGDRAIDCKEAEMYVREIWGGEKYDDIRRKR
jgi:hypothetical protein